MREIRLTKGYKALVDDEDYVRVNRYRWYADVGKYAVYAKSDYINGRRLRMHQFILNASGIDHIDGNGLNNQKSNLRVVSQSANNHNTRFHRNGTSGIWFNKKRNKYEVTLTVNYKKYSIGQFPTLEEAERERNNARTQFGIE